MACACARPRREVDINECLEARELAFALLSYLNIHDVQVVGGQAAGADVQHQEPDSQGGEGEGRKEGEKGVCVYVCMCVCACMEDGDECVAHRA